MNSTLFYNIFVTWVCSKTQLEYPENPSYWMAPKSRLSPRFKVAALNSSVLACISHLIRNIHYLHIAWPNSKESVIIYQANTMHLEIVCILIYTIDFSATRTPTYSLETQLLPEIPPSLFLCFLLYPTACWNFWPCASVLWHGVLGTVRRTVCWDACSLLHASVCAVLDEHTFI